MNHIERDVIVVVCLCTGWLTVFFGVELEEILELLKKLEKK